MELTFKIFMSILGGLGALIIIFIVGITFCPASIILGHIIDAMYSIFMGLSIIGGIVFLPWLLWI